MRKNKVQVWLRIKPTQKFSGEFLNVQNDKKTVHIHIPRDAKFGIINNQVLDWSFPFDGIFHGCKQEEVFNVVGTDVINSSLNGFNSTIMCYGQTGAGKTFTMSGATENFNNRGIIPRSLSHLYRSIEADSNSAVTVRVSYLEIYNEQMYDLLSTLDITCEVQPNMSIVEDDKGGIIVRGLSCHLAQTEEEALNLLFEGESNRATSAHILNKRSSRSHCIFTVYLESRSRMQSHASFSVAKIQFVDLAGSERLQKTQSAGKTMQEASYINKSLSFLEQTVIALSDKQRDHVPFRQSKLTHFLKDSIGGNSKTVLIANVWGEVDHAEEAISTMRFATRMMKVVNEPIENIEYDPSILVRNLQKEISALKHELSMHDTLHNYGHVAYEPLSEQMRFEIREQTRRYAEGELADLDIVNVRQIQGVYEAFRFLYRNLRQDYEDRIKTLTISASQMQQPSQITATTSPGKQNKKDQKEKSSTAVVSAPLSETPQISQQSSKVGDIDRTSGFGVGHADRGQLDESGGYLQSRKKDRKKMVSQNKSNISDVKEDTFDGKPSSEEKVTEIPSRSEAFEEFKKDIGSEIFSILTENKTILSNKKKDYSALANKINSIKIEIDRSTVNLQTMKMERECQGPNYTNEGEMIITEEEYQEIEKLNNYKKEYRQNYEELKNLKSAIYHCQKMVDLTRQRLIKEFDLWFTESYLENDQQLSELNKIERDEIFYEDPIEKFDLVKHSKYEGKPEEEAYSKAREAITHRRVFGAAINQPQPNKRKPGTPVIINKTADLLPNHMDIIQPN